MDPDVVRRAAREVGPIPPSDPGLLATIRAEIARSGPMTFARFMELALYTPDAGYYTSPTPRAAREGDFLTAPETHPIFGAAIARSVAAVWRRLGEPRPFVVREYGAGRGTLAASILTALAADEPELARDLRYEAVEINPDRREEIVTVAPGAVALAPEDAASEPPAAAGYVLANEFLDAFPVHRLIGTASGLREIHVGLAGSGDGLQELAGPVSTPLLEERLVEEGISPAEGQQVEVALGLDDWLAEVAACLAAGVVVVIDYGDRADRLYTAQRLHGTLLGYAGHRAVDDPLQAVGRQDLTAHVDFTAVETAARRHGLELLGLTTQAAFLVDLGLQDLLERARSDATGGMAAYLALRSGLVRLLDPRHTGGFRVLALGRGVPADEAPLPGLRRPGP